VLKDFALGGFNTCARIEVTKSASPTSACAGVSGTADVTYTYTVHNPTGFAEDVTLIDDNETAATTDDIDVPTCTVGGTPTHFTLQKDDSAPGGTDERTFTCTRTLSIGQHVNTVTATATFGSSTDTKTATATVNVNPNPSLSIDSFSCDATKAQLTLTATASGGTAPYNISFDTASCTTCTTLQITRGPGSYTATVTDANGCTATASRKIGVCTDGP
jgi:hypothetical protein